MASFVLRVVLFSVLTFSGVPPLRVATTHTTLCEIAMWYSRVLGYRQRAPERPVCLSDSLLPRVTLKPSDMLLFAHAPLTSTLVVTMLTAVLRYLVYLVPLPSPRVSRQARVVSSPSSAHLRELTLVERSSTYLNVGFYVPYVWY